MYKYISITIAIIAVTTFLIRISLFSFFQRKEVPKIVRYLGNILPFAIMPILVIYCIRGTEWLNYKSIVPVVVGLGATAIIHLIKKNTILSIVIGTAAYMIMLRVL